MAPVSRRNGAKQIPANHQEAPVNDYDRLRIERCMRNSRVFRSLGIQHAMDVLKNSGPNAIRSKASRPKAAVATREDYDPLYQPRDDEDTEQGVFHKDLEPELNVSTTAGGTRTSKRVMAVAVQEHDQPTRVTRQRTRELASPHEVPTTDPQDGSTEEDALMSDNANTQSNNQDELSIEGRCIRKRQRHIGRDLDKISRGLSDKIPVHILEGNLRPQEPLQAARLASEAGIILRNHVPVFTHWKQYKAKENIGVVKNYNEKLATQFTIDVDAEPVKDAFSDLLRKG